MSAVVEGSELHVGAEARPDAEGYLASLEWRTWVRGHPWAAAAIAGLVAGQMATIVGYFFNAVGLPQLNWPAVNGGLVLPGGEPGAQWFAGLFVHTVDSVVFAMLFVILVWRLIPFRNTSAGNVGRGVIYSLVLADHQCRCPRAVRLLPEGGPRPVQLRHPVPAAAAELGGARAPPCTPTSGGSCRSRSSSGTSSTASSWSALRPVRSQEEQVGCSTAPLSQTAGARARNPAIGLVPSAGTARRRRSLTRGEAHLRDRRRCQLPRQGAHRLLARATPEAPGTAGHDAEARPVHQRRPRHDEPLRARRGLRDRRRRRDRPRPRPLRAVHRREPVPCLERHDGLDLPVGAGRRAAGRLPGTHRAGHPAHHRRDQAAGAPARPPRTSTSSSPRSAAPSATSRSCPSSRRCGSSARTSVARTSATCTSPSCPSSAPRASRRPSRPSTRSPSCAAGASSPT